MQGRAPFRADQVGSLLRPPELKQARADFRAAVAGRALPRGKGHSIAAAGLRAVEDKCIAAAVRRQEQAGLRAVTDGEYRRAWWHFDFLAGLDGAELVTGTRTIQFAGVETKAENIEVNGRVGFSGHPMLEHFGFLKDQTGVMPKMTIPSPTVLHFRPGRQAISDRVYPELGQFFEDTALAYRGAVRAFYDAGCRYLQFDDTVWAYLCSDKERQAARERGDDPEGLPEQYAAMISKALAEKPPDMFVTTHVCRGNFRSSWISEGGYEPVAELLLGGTPYDGYFLEYDTERAGGFEPLRFLPKGNKRVVLGLVTSKFPALEGKDDLKRRIEQAGKFVDTDQLCLSPQCGFASTEEGNILTADEQWKKLELVVEVATEVWGGL